MMPFSVTSYVSEVILRFVSHADCRRPDVGVACRSEEKGVYGRIHDLLGHLHNDPLHGSRGGPSAARC